MNRRGILACGVLASATLLSCGGGSTGTQRDSGVNKTYLSVDAADADGDSLHYQWRVTGGSIDNKDARETVWTMPDGDGLYFAYVAVSDGKGGRVEQQYAVSTDTLGTHAVTPAAIDRTPAAIADFAGTTTRLRLRASNDTDFQPPAGGEKASRMVYLPDVQVEVRNRDTGAVAYTALSDLRGEVDLPKLPVGNYTAYCASQGAATLEVCASFPVGDEAVKQDVLFPAESDTQKNLRLFGHVGLADGSLCGYDSEFFAAHAAATVQLRDADGTALGGAVHVNRFGDYQISAGVPVRGALKAEVRCEDYVAVLDVPVSSDPAGYASNSPVELSHAIANQAPRVVNMVASGADGNVRGRMIVPGSGAGFGSVPGNDHFLTYKGADSLRSACMYYLGLGAVATCDAEGNPGGAISFEDWKRQNGFGTAADVAADYVNQRDLNLVRRMVATQSAPDHSAFYVCNSPGPDGTSQTEVDATIEDALTGQKRVACVAMEYSTQPGVNNGQPFTKFFTFGPTGSLLLSINLDGRGEKYLPGSCVACHGGSIYNGRFPEKAVGPVPADGLATQAQAPSPYLGSRFLPFDTGNYLFSSKASLSESAQTESFFQLNQLVRGTELNDATPTAALIQGWYATSHTLDKNYLPQAWQDEDARVPGAARFYREAVAISCRTCHVAFDRSRGLDWNSVVLSTGRVKPYFCGGTSDLAANASMPNALVSGDRLLERIANDVTLSMLASDHYLGCSAPGTDPIYPKKQ